MLIYYNEVGLDDGFAILSKGKEDRLVRGWRVSQPSGWALYESLRAAGEPLKCWACGLEASCWVVNKGATDFVRPPVMDLFAVKNGSHVLMTRDHIIPKSYGGVNNNENLRVGCSPCNGDRGNSMSIEDIDFMIAHPELIRADAPAGTLAAAQLAAKKDRKRLANRRRNARRKARRAEAISI